MDLYYAITNYHLICCLLHKMIYNTKKDATLVISSFLTNSQPTLLNAIKNSNIFKKVVVYNEIEVTKTEKLLNNNELKKEIDRICSLVEKVIGKQLKTAQNIYLCSDFYSIGFYLIKNKIPYYYFEDGCGTISQPNLPLRIFEKGDPNRAQIAKKLNVFGNNQYVINRFANLKEQIEGYSNQKDIHFDVKELLNTISPEQVETILKLYDTKKIKETDNNLVLLLTMHYNEIVSIKEQEIIYSNLLDYFTEETDKVLIKPHPADSITYYEKLFPAVKVINRKMPSELFPYCINQKINKGITCWSTSIFGLKDILENIINFDTRIDDTYKDFDKYYAITRYLDCIKTNKKIKIKFQDINEIQLLQLMKYHFKDYEKYYTITEENPDIYITDKLTDDLLNKKVIILHSKLIGDNTIKITRKNKSKEETEYVVLHNIDFTELSEIKKLKYSKSSITINIIKKEQNIEELYKINEKQKNEFEKKEESLNLIIENKEKEISNNQLTIQELDKEKEKIRKEMQQKIDSIYDTTSWKITKPIRSLADIIRKIKR